MKIPSLLLVKLLIDFFAVSEDWPRVVDISAHEYCGLVKAEVDGEFVLVTH